MRLFRVQILFFDDLTKLLFPFLRDILMPLTQHIGHFVDAIDKVIDQRLFAAKFRAGVDRLMDGDENFLVVAMRIVILFDQQKDIIDVDLDLFDELHLKHDIIGNIFLIPFTAARLPFIAQILIFSEIILQVALGEQFLFGKVVKRSQKVAHPQDRPEEYDELFL